MTSRRMLVGAAAIVTALVTSGCGTGTTTVKTGNDWLVKVNGDFANIYRYPLTNFPGNTSEAVNLGQTGADKKDHLSAAAKKLGVPVSNVTDLTGS